MMSFATRSTLLVLLFSFCSNLPAVLTGPLQAIQPVAQTYIYLDSLGPNFLSPKAANVSYQECSGDTRGHVHFVNINPCDRSSDSEPCTFVYGRNYTIELGFTSDINATRPRSSVVANDPGDGPYAYSGQTFNACLYADCPIEAGQPSVYTYHFHTLQSAFNYLTFNVTQDFEGPSLLCAGTAVDFKLK